MPLVKAMCGNCGASLEVDNNKEAAICPFCNTAYIVEKAINNYNIQNTYNISNGIGVEQKLKNAKTFLQLGNTHKAFEIYDELTDICTDDYRIWEGLFNCTNKIEYYESMVKLNSESTEKHKDTITKIADKCISYINNDIEQLIKNKESINKTIDETFLTIKKNTTSNIIWGIILIVLPLVCAIFMLLDLFALFVIALMLFFVAIFVFAFKQEKRSLLNSKKDQIENNKKQIEKYDALIEENNLKIKNLQEGDINTIKDVQHYYEEDMPQEY